MFSILISTNRIVNIDETWINETNFSRKAWLQTSSPGTEPLKPVSPSLSMIAALDTEGQVYFALSHAATD